MWLTFWLGLPLRSFFFFLKCILWNLGLCLTNCFSGPHLKLFSILLSFFLSWFVWDRFLLCSSSWSGTHWVAKAGLELVIFLLQSLTGVCHTGLLLFSRNISVECRSLHWWLFSACWILWSCGFCHCLETSALSVTVAQVNFLSSCFSDKPFLSVYLPFHSDMPFYLYCMGYIVIL
jgi:hypothetical protein